MCPHAHESQLTGLGDESIEERINSVEKKVISGDSLKPFNLRQRRSRIHAVEQIF